MSSKYDSLHDISLRYMTTMMEANFPPPKHDGEACERIISAVLHAVADHLDAQDRDDYYVNKVSVEDLRHIANAQPDPVVEESLQSQVDRLATVLMDEFGGPVASEGAVDTAIRFLRGYKLLTGKAGDK